MHNYGKEYNMLMSINLFGMVWAIRTICSENVVIKCKRNQEVGTEAEIFFSHLMKMILFIPFVSWDEGGRTTFWVSLAIELFR